MDIVLYVEMQCLKQDLFWLELICKRLLLALSRHLWNKNVCMKLFIYYPYKLQGKTFPHANFYFTVLYQLHWLYRVIQSCSTVLNDVVIIWSKNVNKCFKVLPPFPSYNAFTFDYDRLHQNGNNSVLYNMSKERNSALCSIFTCNFRAFLFKYLLYCAVGAW
jgi:hypothetical protein